MVSLGCEWLLAWSVSVGSGCMHGEFQLRVVACMVSFSCGWLLVCMVSLGCEWLLAWSVSVGSGYMHGEFQLWVVACMHGEFGL